MISPSVWRGGFQRSVRNRAPTMAASTDCGAVSSRGSSTSPSRADRPGGMDGRFDNRILVAFSFIS